MMEQGRERRGGALPGRAGLCMAGPGKANQGKLPDRWRNLAVGI